MQISVAGRQIPPQRVIQISLLQTRQPERVQLYPFTHAASIFSLHHTTDYNPRHYQHVAPNNGQAGKFDSRFESGNLNYAYQCM
jgi:hypothetical protein